MIDIGFINLIFIIADNTSDFKELDNPYLSAIGALGSPRPFTFVVSGISRLFAFIVSDNSHICIPVKFFDSNYFMADFLVDILTNSLDNFSVDTFSDLIVDAVFSFTILFLSNFLAFSQFLQDNLPALATNTFLLLIRMFFSIILLALVAHYLFSYSLAIPQLPNISNISLVLVVCFFLLSYPSIIPPHFLLLVEIFF